jgi:hypothetical protein
MPRSHNNGRIDFYFTIAFSWGFFLSAEYMQLLQHSLSLWRLLLRKSAHLK